MNTSIKFALLAATGMAICATSAHAQSSAPEQTQSQGGLEEIVVTARKRTESLQNVPVAVFALSKVALQNNNAVDLNRVAELAPQVVIGRAVSGTGAIITIRGISSGSTDSGVDQSVAIDLDGVALSRGRIIGATLFDMQQVEVLQGPQALFFGKNSPAGVISMTSVDPTNRFEGYVKAGYEFEAKERTIEGAMGGPLSDNLKVRLALRGNWIDGWIKNTSKGSANPFQPQFPFPGASGQDMGPHGHNYTGRVTLLYTPTDSFEAKFKLTRDEQKLNSNAAYGEPFCINGVTTPVTAAGVPYPDADCKKDRRKAETALPAGIAALLPYANGGIPYAGSKFTLASLNLNQDFGNFTLTSTTGYYNQRVANSANADYSSFVQIYSVEREQFSVLTQELRLNTDLEGPFNVMVGGYFEHADRHWYNMPDLFHVLDPVANTYATNIQQTNSDTDSYSVFGQLRWNLMDNLELSGGARYSIDNKKSVLTNTYNNLQSATGRTLRAQGVPLISHFADNNVSPEVTLTWHPQPGSTVYAAYKTGYKSGGISNAALLSAVSTADSIKFGSEKTNGFEGGYKADLFDRTLRLDLNAYRYNYKGLQVTFSDTRFFRFVLGNAASARTEGVSGSFKWLATDQLSFDGNAGYNKARYLDFKNAPCYTAQTASQGCLPNGANGANVQDLSGKRLVRAPKITYKIGADYKVPVAENWTADFSASGAYSGTYQTATDYTPGGVQKSYWLLNAAVHLTSDDDKFDLAVIGRNLTNSYYMVYSFIWAGTNNPNEYVGLFNRPREVSLQATYRF